MWQIILSDDTELMAKWCGASDGVLWIDGLNMTLFEALAIFSEVSKTAHIIAPGNIAHDGYTNLIHLSLSREGLVKVALRKEG